jgi:hypothetical protein
MMRLKIARIGEGLHPREAVVSVQTRTGPISMVVDPTVILPDDTVSIGWPVGREDDFFLVELPRETMHGSWRVWVAANELENGERIQP